MRRIPLVCGAFLVALGAVALVETFRLRDGWLGARLMPAVVGASLVILGLAHRAVPAVAPEWPGPAGGARVVGVLALLTAYVVALPWLGFLPATALLVLPLVRALGGWSWPLTLVTTAAIAVACHVVFKHWLGMPLPPGPLGL